MTSPVLPLFSFAVLGLAALASSTGFAADARLTSDWPAWRGPRADGIADGRSLPTQWSQTKNVRWSAKLPGWGTSSPVVHGNRVFVTSAPDILL
jgi:outer membrane protein assembly factor BamB